MNKTERIFKIEQLIAARKLVAFQTLQDELEVSRATLKRRRLQIAFHSRATNETTERAVSPQCLVCCRENWYLDAWCHLRQDIRSFAVDGIRQAEILAQAAREITDSQLDAVLGESYGIFSGRARAWARLRFTPARARWVATEEWHPRQRASFEPDGSYVLEFPYGDDRELLGDILRHGPEVEVLAPRELRARCRDQLKAAQRLYSP